MRVPLLAFSGLAAISLLGSATANQQQQVFPPLATNLASGNLPAATPAVSYGGGTLAQTLGPWELNPPNSATLITGGGTLFGWLNAVNTPISLSDAMASSPIESGGYANADSGTIIEVTFSSGVVNLPGPDLVMLDSQFDAGRYIIRSDYDGFVASVVANTNGGIFATTSSLYYEIFTGPWLTNVVGVEIDLSSIGVPAGASVNSLRFTCDNGGCDPISLAKIGVNLILTVSPLTVGSTGTFDATGGTPSGTIGIGFSLLGSGPALVNTGNCGMMTVDLTPPIGVLTIQTADASGDISFSATVPSSAGGRTVHFQALDFGSCTLSNGVSVTIP